MICNGCPRKCGAERNEEKGRGYCKMPLSPVLARAGLHFGEEPCITAQNGSGTVFFSGCSLQCVFCQNFEVSHKQYGKRVTISRLAEIFKELEQQGAENINLVCPSHYAVAIHEALALYRPDIPIVYNSGGYDSIESLELLKDDIDVYLMDFKFFDNERAKRYAGATHYVETVKTALLRIAEQLNCRCEFDENGKMTKGLIIRHLIMPQGTNDAIRIIEWCEENLSFAAFSLMAQYLPMGDAEQYQEINRRITAREYEKVLRVFENTSFCRQYVQERSSATDIMIPDFDCSGV